MKQTDDWWICRYGKMTAGKAGMYAVRSWNGYCGLYWTDLGRVAETAEVDNGWIGMEGQIVAGWQEVGRSGLPQSGRFSSVEQAKELVATMHGKVKWRRELAG